MNFLRHILFASILLAPLLAMEVHADVSFGGNCASQGSWTQEAIKQMNEIRSTIETLRNNKHCNKDVVDALYRSFSLDNELGGEVSEAGQRFESLPGEMSSLQSIVNPLNHVQMDTDSRAGLLGMLIMKTVEKVDLGQNQLMTKFRTNSGKTLKHGMSAVAKLLPMLPQLDQCIYNNPGLAKPLFSGIFSLMSTFISSGGDGYARTSQLLQGYTEYLQASRFSKVLREMDMSQFILSMSCVMESTTEAYCAAKEAMEVQNFLIADSEKQKAERRAGKKKPVSTNNPLEGYFIISREVPIVTEWIQKVQRGVRPRQSSDATYKNGILENISSLLKSVNTVMGSYGTSVHNYKAISGLEQQRNFVLKVVKDLTDTLDGGFMEGSDSMNFFTQTISTQKLPFYLIGRTTVPDKVAIGQDGVQISWDDFFFNGGEYIEEFKDPTDLLEKIGLRLSELLVNAENAGGKYFQANYIIDLPNLVSETVISQTISVYDSLVRIRNYLNKLVVRINSLGPKNRTATDRIIFANIISTIKRIDSILALYKQLGTRSEEYMVHFKKKDVQQIIKLVEDDEQFERLYSEIVLKVYFEFNVLIQRDSFLSTRLSTFVKYDLAYYTKYKSSLTNHQQELLVAANTNVLDRLLNGALSTDPHKVREDLNTAQMINATNLQAIETLFADTLVPTISKLDRLAKGQKANGTAMWVDSLKRFGKDSFTAPYNFAPMMYNILFRSDKYITFPGRVREVELKELPSKTYAQFKARLCIQTLAFQKKSQFFDLCKDSYIRSTFKNTDGNNSLKLSYADMLLKYAQAVQSKSRVAVAKRQDENRCALRDFRRKNSVYWMIQSFK